MADPAKPVNTTMDDEGMSGGAYLMFTSLAIFSGVIFRQNVKSFSITITRATKFFVEFVVKQFGRKEGSEILKTVGDSTQPDPLSKQQPSEDAKEVPNTPHNRMDTDVLADDQPDQSLDGEKKKRKKKKKKKKVTSDEQPRQPADGEVTTVSNEVKELSKRDELRQKLRAKIASSRGGGNNNKTHVDTQQQDRVSGFRQQGEHGAKMRIKP